MSNTGKESVDLPLADPLRRAAEKERPAFSPAFHERIMDAIRQTAPADQSSPLASRSPGQSRSHRLLATASLAATVLLAAYLLWQRTPAEHSQTPALTHSAALSPARTTNDVMTTENLAVDASPRVSAERLEEMQDADSLYQWSPSALPADHLLVLPLATDALAAALIDPEWDDLRHDVQQVLSLVADPLPHQRTDGWEY